jgi:hypothetical protein
MFFRGIIEKSSRHGLVNLGMHILPLDFENNLLLVPFKRIFYFSFENIFDILKRM